MLYDHNATRAAFEAFYFDQGAYLRLIKRDETGVFYASRQTETAWKIWRTAAGWQAGRCALLAEAKKE
jgi:hypothetical protein